MLSDGILLNGIRFVLIPVKSAKIAFLVICCQERAVLCRKSNVPHCHTAFTIDESAYDHIVAQVRNQAFLSEVQEVLLREHEKHAGELRLAERLAEKERELMAQQQRFDLLSAQLEQLNRTQALTVQQAVGDKEREILALQHRLAEADGEAQRAREAVRQELALALHEKDKLIIGLQAQERQVLLEKAQEIRELDFAKEQELAR